MKMDPAAFIADQELIDELNPYASPVDCGEDRVLFYQGDTPAGLYIFHSGEVVMTMKSTSGDVVMRIRVEPGSLLGLPGLVGNAGYSLSAVASAGTKVTFVNREEFSRLMLSVPSISVGILKVLAAEVRTARLALVER